MGSGLLSGSVEASGGAQEAGGAEEDELAASAGGRGGLKAFFHDGLDAPDMNEIEVERALAGGLEPHATVLVAEP